MQSIDLADRIEVFEVFALDEHPLEIVRHLVVGHFFDLRHRDLAGSGALGGRGPYDLRLVRGQL